MTDRGKHKVLIGIDYRVGDGWRRAEPGSIVTDLDDITDADYRSLRELKAIEPVKARGPARSTRKPRKGKP